VCYQGEHPYAAALAFIVLVTFVAGLPLYWLRILYIGHRKRLMESKLFRKRWGFLYRQIKARYYYFRLLDYFFSFALSLGIVFLGQQVRTQMWMSFVVFSVQLIVLTWWCPHLTKARNLMMMGFTDARLAVVTIIAFVGKEPVSAGVICALSALLIIGGWVLVHTIWRHKLEGAAETENDEGERDNSYVASYPDLDATVDGERRDSGKPGHNYYGGAASQISQSYRLGGSLTANPLQSTTTGPIELIDWASLQEVQSTPFDYNQARLNYAQTHADTAAVAVGDDIDHTMLPPSSPRSDDGR